jgi:hypothetical protein
MSFLLLAFPLFWPAIVSYFIKPNRIVSPSQVVFGSWAVDTIATLVVCSGIASRLNSASAPPFTNAQAVYGDFFLYSMLFFMMAMVIGLYENLAVKWLVGLDIEGLNRKTYSVLVNAEEVASVMQSDAFNPKWKRSIVIEPGLLVIRWRLKTDETVLLGLMRDPRAPHARSIVATVAYYEASFYITEDEDASNMRDTLMNDLETRLRRKNPSAQFGEEESNDLATVRVNAIARASGDSKLASGRTLFFELSTYLKAAIILTVLGLFLTPFGAYFKLGNFDYGGIFVVLFVTLVAELGLAVKDEVAKRRGLKETWPPEEA